ncbi:MAG: sensor histidine kinase [Actinomycetota bacterium]
MLPAAPWLPRAFRITIWADWLALVIGIIPAVYSTGGSAGSLVASGLAGLCVLLAGALPRHRLTQRFVAEGFVLVSALLATGAVTLTGVRDSPFLLLSLIPPIQATILRGLRSGAATGALTGALIIAAELGQDQPAVVPAIGLAVIYLVVVATVTQLVRILNDISSRAAESEARSRGAEQKLANLEQAHGLLSRLAEMRLDGTSLPDIGREALEVLVSRSEIEGAVAVLERPSGPLIVAQTGAISPGAGEHRVPLRVGPQEVGGVRLFLSRQGPPPDETSLETTLRPLALAFANSLLLEDIARQAVERERVRLARDLHDEIGPSIASLGLSLDVALMQHQTEPALAAHMQDLRENVGVLIRDIRATVADLRAQPAGSLGGRLQDVVLGLGSGPTVLVEVDERRPPRPAIMGDLVAILAEAIRNAHRHAKATYVRVGGWTDFDRGEVGVIDNGTGFEPSEGHEGHYGLIGMKERASKLGIDLAISTGNLGTSVTLHWGQR